MSAPGEILQAVPQLVEALEASVMPANDLDLAKQIDRLIEFIQIVGLPLPNADGLAKLYKEELGHLPADLLARAVDETRANHKYHVVPTPGNVLERVNEQLRMRQAEHRTAVLVASRLAE